jgi:hypothetical protein
MRWSRKRSIQFGTKFEHVEALGEGRGVRSMGLERGSEISLVVGPELIQLHCPNKDEIKE